MIPKIEFRYSDVYDRNYRDSKKIQEYLKNKNEEYPSRKEIIDYTKKVEKLWRKKEKKILIEISKITGLKWKEKRIICYVVGCGQPFSDPLTIRTYGKDFEIFIDTLTHELIHQISTQNEKIFMRWYNYIKKKYTNEERTTKTHIFLTAVHWKILEKMFTKKRLEIQIKNHGKYSEYRRAWEIVEEEGKDNIIKKFKQITKK